MLRDNQHVPIQGEMYNMRTRIPSAEGRDIDPAGDVCIYMPRELIIQNEPNEEWDEEDEKFPYGGRGSIFQVRRATTCEGVTEDERSALEELLARLLKNLNTGLLDHDDLIQLVSICATLNIQGLNLQSLLGQEALSIYTPGPITDASRSTIQSNYSGLDSVKESAKDHAKDSAIDSSKISAKDSAIDSAKDPAGDLVKHSSKISAKDSAGDLAKDSSMIAATDSAGDLAKDSSKISAKDSAGDLTKDSSEISAKDSAGDLTKDSSKISAKDSANSSVKTSANNSMTSGLERFLGDTLGKAYQENHEKDEQEDMLENAFVEETIRHSINQLSRDMHDGTLSREDVREIGSAVASVILGNVRSDESVIADDVVVPTLEMLLRDAQDIDEVLLDQTMAALVSSYNQVSRRQGKMVWQVIKDFVVEVLLRTRTGMLNEMVNIPLFLSGMEDCRVTDLHGEMELPKEDEIILVMTQATRKLADVHKLSPTLCELMKIILDQGQPLLIERQGPEGLVLPKIDTTKLQKVGESACGLEVVLEVAATVADGLYRDMLMEAKFESRIQVVLAPAFLFTLLSCWGEMVASVPKETIALQTASKEIAYTPTAAENIILLAFHAISREASQQRLPISVVSHLALHIAEFPALMPVQSVFEHDEEGKVRIPPFVMRKIHKLGTALQQDAVCYQDVKKLLAVVLHIYIRERLLADDASLPPVTLENESDVHARVTFFTTNVLTKVLDFVQRRVRVSAKESLEESAGERRVEMGVVTDVISVMADMAAMDVEKSTIEGLRPSDQAEAQLQDIIRSTTRTDDNAEEHPKTLSIPEFLERIATSTQICPSKRSPNIPDLDDFRTTADLIRNELGTMAKDVAYQFTSMGALQKYEHNDTCPPIHKMITFIVSLLVELKKSLKAGSLSASFTLTFLRAVAPEKCLGREQHPSLHDLEDIVMAIVYDVEWKKDKSLYFSRIVNKLSALSLEAGPQDEQVAESMAATAHMLSSVNAVILHQFVQTTLVSLLNAMRQSSKSALNVTSIATQEGTPGGIPSSSADSARGLDGRTPVSPLADQTEPGAPQAPNANGNFEAVKPISSDNNEGLRSNGKQRSRNSTEEEALTEQVLGRYHIRNPKLGPSEIMNVKEKEICHEAGLMARIALRSTLERVMGGLHYPGLNGHPVPEVVEHLVGSLYDFANKSKSRELFPCRKFSHLDLSMQCYAQSLLEEVCCHLTEPQHSPEISGVVEAPPRVSNQDITNMAAMIIDNTFKSIDAGLMSGLFKCQSDTAVHSCRSDRITLARRIYTTLHAVRLELDLLTLTASVHVKESNTSQLHNKAPQSAVGTKLTLSSASIVDKQMCVSNESLLEGAEILKTASQIVDVLIERVSADTGAEATVEFYLTRDNKLSDDARAQLAENQRKLSEQVMKTEKETIWDLPTADIEAAIIQTFCDVLSDMHSQNQFFHPDMTEEEVILPSLPYLLDEFILNNVQSTLGIKIGSSDTPPIPHLRPETIMVAAAFIEVIHELIGDEDNIPEGPEDAENLKQKAHRICVMSVLENNFKRVLAACYDEEVFLPVKTMSSTETVYENTSERDIDIRSPHKRNSKIKNDLNKLLHSIAEVSLASKLSSSVISAAPDSHAENCEVVTHAVRQILTSLQDAKVHADALNDLAANLLEDSKDLHSPTEKTDKLIEVLTALIDDIGNDKISPAKVEQAATELEFLGKGNQEDFSNVAHIVRKISSGQSNKFEYLKMAVADLLLGIKESSDRSLTSNVSNDPVSDLHNGDMSNDNKSSITARTVSKMNIFSHKDNREDNLKTVYSTAIIKGSVPVISANAPAQGGASIVWEERSTSNHCGRDESPGLDFSPRVSDTELRREPKGERGDHDDSDNTGAAKEEEIPTKEPPSEAQTNIDHVLSTSTDFETIVTTTTSIGDILSRGQSATDAVTTPLTESTPEAVATPITESTSEAVTTAETESTPEAVATPTSEPLSISEEVPTTNETTEPKTPSTPRKYVSKATSSQRFSLDATANAETTKNINEHEEVESRKTTSTSEQRKESKTNTKRGGPMSVEWDKYGGGGVTEAEDWEGEEERAERTESWISKSSGSKASLEAATSEDWNYSAVRVTRHDYDSRIDQVRACDNSKRLPLIPCHHAQTHKPRQVSVDRKDRQSGMYCKPTARMTGTPPASNTKLEEMYSREVEGRPPNVRKTKFKNISLPLVPRSESANALHEFVSGRSSAEQSHSSLQTSHTQETMGTDDLISLKRSSSITLHQYTVSIDKNRDQAIRSSTSWRRLDFVSRQKRGTSYSDLSKSSSTKSKSDVAEVVHPYLQKQLPVSFRLGPDAVNTKASRAEQKAFAAGYNMFNSDKKQRLRSQQKEKSMAHFHQAVAAALEEYDSSPDTSPRHRNKSSGKAGPEVTGLPPGVGAKVPRPPAERRKQKHSREGTAEGVASIKHQAKLCKPDTCTEKHQRKAHENRADGAELDMSPKPPAISKSTCVDSAQRDAGSQIRARRHMPKERSHEDTNSELKGVQAKPPNMIELKVGGSAQAMLETVKSVLSSSARVPKRPFSEQTLPAKDGDRGREDTKTKLKESHPRPTNRKEKKVDGSAREMLETVKTASSSGTRVPKCPLSDQTLLIKTSGEKLLKCKGSQTTGRPELNEETAAAFTRHRTSSFPTISHLGGASKGLLSAIKHAVGTDLPGPSTIAQCPVVKLLGSQQNNRTIGMPSSTAGLKSSSSSSSSGQKASVTGKSRSGEESSALASQASTHKLSFLSGRLSVRESFVTAAQLCAEGRSHAKDKSSTQETETSSIHSFAPTENLPGKGSKTSLFSTSEKRSIAGGLSVVEQTALKRKTFSPKDFFPTLTAKLQHSVSGEADPAVGRSGPREMSPASEFPPSSKTSEQSHAKSRERQKQSTNEHLSSEVKSVSEQRISSKLPQSTAKALKVPHPPKRHPASLPESTSIVQGDAQNQPTSPAQRKGKRLDRHGRQQESGGAEERTVGGSDKRVAAAANATELNYAPRGDSGVESKTPKAAQARRIVRRMRSDDPAAPALSAAICPRPPGYPGFSRK